MIRRMSLRRYGSTHWSAARSPNRTRRGKRSSAKMASAAVLFQLKPEAGDRVKFSRCSITTIAACLTSILGEETWQRLP